jgi:biotin operon repressor
MSKLREHGIIVTAVHNHWLFDEPRLMYMHFESIDQPLSFARKVRDALSVLTTRNVYPDCRAITSDYSNSSNLCDRFNNILGGSMHTFENGICTVMKSRTNIHPEVLGRRGRSFLLIPQMFTFESMTGDGQALCSGETVILQTEINPFITKLREHGIIVTAVHNHWLFDQPRLMFMHFESIDQPLSFARKVKDALSVLTTRQVYPKE